MPGFFEAFSKLPEPKVNKPKVRIDGKELEVSLELFKEVMANGADKYSIVDGKIVKKQQEMLRRYCELEEGEEGYQLLDGDPFWPSEIVKGGLTWRR